MEERITAIIERIESSSLSEEDKMKMIGMISEGLKASIWPTLLSHMPQDKLEAFTKEPGKATIEGYLSLIEDATTDEKVLDEIHDTMNALLDEVEAVLTEEKL